MPKPCRPERRHDSFRDIVRDRVGAAVTSHLLPAYARVDLAFERGEGVWLYATDGERYLDFASGVAVNALGHAHPRVVEAIAAQGAKAMECVIKMVRKYQSASGKPERYRIMTFEGAFHGRTLAMLAAAKNKKH